MYQFLWDMPDEPDGNVQHCLDHDVTQDEWEEVFFGEDTEFVASSSHPEHDGAFGFTDDGRHLRIIFKDEGDGVIRPITAYETPPRRK